MIWVKESRFIYNQQSGKKKLSNPSYFNSHQEMFEKRRRRRESHNAVERRRRDNINERIQGIYRKQNSLCV